MSTKNIVTLLVIIVLVAGGAYYFSRGSYTVPAGTPPAPPAVTNQNGTTPKSTDSSTPAPVETNKVEITANGFSPSTIKVRAGDTVTWTNKDSAPHWPATAAHPTHLVYPGSDITKCGTAAQSGIFDACKGLAPGESFPFKFDQAGTWKYHDHMNPVAPFFGSVTVE
ncbi:MAG: plastocyanin/azurin family copper-binding protein [Patescibacteria group bacterium]